MANPLPGDISYQGVNLKRPSKYHYENLEDDDQWYLSKKEIEENSPSRADGIDLKKETYLRKSYCTFLQDLGMRLRVPQITIATAIICCHRFYLRQSHARSDRRVIATVCMFLAGKMEESPRPLKDVIYVAYEIIHKKDPEAFQRIKQKEVYEQQKELILDGERLVLTTLGFGLNVHHPYKPLVEAIKKFKVAQNTLAQVAWNFVNDGLRTSLCLQFKPHHIAAGAIFLAAKFLKVKLPSDGEKVWWQEFDVNPRQLEEVSNQMLELYEQNRVPPTASETEGSTVGGSNQRPLAKSSSADEEHATKNGYYQAAATPVKPSSHKLPPTDNRSAPLRTSQDQSENHGSIEKRGALVNDGKSKVLQNEVEKLPSQENARDDQSTMILATDRLGKDQERNGFGNEMREPVEAKDKHTPPDSEYRESTVGPSPQEAIKKIDIHKVKAALGKRRKAKGDVARKTDFLDEDDLIERELENGIELASDNDKNQGRRQSSFKPMDKQEEPGEMHHGGIMGQSTLNLDQSNMEEGEVPLSDSRDYGFHSPKSSNRKRKGRSPPEKSTEGRQWNDHLPSSNHYNYYDQDGDRNRTSRQDYTDRNQKRYKQENHG